jgi:hypothetical protein
MKLIIFLLKYNKSFDLYGNDLNKILLKLQPWFFNKKSFNSFAEFKSDYRVMLVEKIDEKKYIIRRNISATRGFYLKTQIEFRERPKNNIDVVLNCSCTYIHWALIFLMSTFVVILMSNEMSILLALGVLLLFYFLFFIYFLYEVFLYYNCVKEVVVGSMPLR